MKDKKPAVDITTKDIAEELTTEKPVINTVAKGVTDTAKAEMAVVDTATKKDGDKLNDVFEKVLSPSNPGQKNYR